MAEPSPTTSVKILGEEYRVRGGSPEAVAELAGFVDGRFRELQAARPALDMKRLAVMVCMNIAEELYVERARRAGLLRAACERTRLCRESLETALKPSPDPAPSGDGGGAVRGR